MGIKRYARTVGESLDKGSGKLFGLTFYNYFIPTGSELFAQPRDGALTMLISRFANAGGYR